MGGILGNFGGRYRDDLEGRFIKIHGKRFLFQRLIGTGGFGAVYAAQAPDGLKVAVKVIELKRMQGISARLIRSYLTEVEHLTRLRLQSNHVVRIYDFDFDSRSGRAYIVMELGDENLTKFIERLRASSHRSHKPGTYVQPQVRKQIWRQLVSIVATLTASNIVHMDLKPDNFILFGRTIKIADLGIAKKPEMLHHAGVGTPYFSPPEVMQASPGHRSYHGPKADIWSLGAILYYMTYGRPPSYGSRAAAPPYGQSPARDPALIDILYRTLVRNPYQRADINTVLQHPYTLS